MADVTLRQLAEVVGIPFDRLILQLGEACPCQRGLGAVGGCASGGLGPGAARGVGVVPLAPGLVPGLALRGQVLFGGGDSGVSDEDVGLRLSGFQGEQADAGAPGVDGQ